VAGALHLSSPCRERDGAGHVLISTVITTCRAERLVRDGTAAGSPLQELQPDRAPQILHI